MASIFPLFLIHTLWHLTCSLPTKAIVFLYSMTWSLVTWLALASGIWAEVTILFYILNLTMSSPQEHTKAGPPIQKAWGTHKGDLNPPNSLQSNLTSPKLDQLKCSGLTDMWVKKLVAISHLRFVGWFVKQH